MLCYMKYLPHLVLLLVFPGSKIDGNEIEVTLAKPVDKDHRQAKLAAKAMMSAYNFMPFEYPPAFVFPQYNSPYMTIPPPPPMAK